jgi:hypothetical protein
MEDDFKIAHRQTGCEDVNWIQLIKDVAMQ